MTQGTEEMLQWHSAFAAAIQIELEEEIGKLFFETEHLLSKKPMQIDELIIKVKNKEKINKNIGRIFRQYNIIEYKSPEDYLSINDFYKVYGYTCFYQSDTEKVCEIPPNELTITFICNHYPRKMLKHLQRFRRLEVVNKGRGIYYLTGDSIPIQLLITKELDSAENRWLQSLRTDLKGKDEIESILQSYEKKKSSKLYQAAMNVIARANWSAMKEVKATMCEALRELMAEEFEEERRQVTEQVTEQVIRNAFESIQNVDKVSAILKIPVEIVRKAVEETTK